MSLGNNDDPRVMDWFDARKKEHLVAYRHIQKHGHWPPGWPIGPLCGLWTVVILNKLADAYIEDQGLR